MFLLCSFEHTIFWKEMYSLKCSIYYYLHIPPIKSHFFISQVFSKKSSSSSWYYDKRKSGGGCLMTMGSHLIFLLYELFGPIEKVKGTTTKMYTNVEDSVSVLGVLKSGVPISIEGSWMKKGLILKENCVLKYLVKYSSFFIYVSLRK